MPVAPSRKLLGSAAAEEGERAHFDVRGTTRGDKRSTPLLSTEGPAGSSLAGELSDPVLERSCCGGSSGADLAVGCVSEVEEPDVPDGKCLLAWCRFPGRFGEDELLSGVGSVDGGDNGDDRDEDRWDEGLRTSLQEEASRCRRCCWDR